MLFVGVAAWTINKNLDGAIDIENSSNLVVRGWQMSANGSDHLAPDLWVHLSPGGGTISSSAASSGGSLPCSPGQPDVERRKGELD